MKQPAILLIGIFFMFSNCSEKPKYDLVIENVQLFDSRNKKVESGRTILINGDSIVAVINSKETYQANTVIKGAGRLVTPGFIDTHTHLDMVIGDEDHAPDLIDDTYRELFASTYLKFGTTTIIDMGQSEKWIDTSIKWQKQPSPIYPNLFITGAALISDEEREPAFTHAEVFNPDDAKLKIKTYSDLGIKHIKLYSRLRLPEMEAIVKEANKSNLTLSGHIDRGGVTIPDAIRLGVRNFEHLLSLPTNVINQNDHWDLLNEKYDLKRIESIDEWVAVMIFFFEYIKDNPKYNSKMIALIDELAEKNTTLSTTIHQMAAVTEKTYFFTSFGDDEQQTLNLPNYTDAHKEKLKKAYKVMMDYLKYAHGKGVKLRIGTDCRRGGEALLSELLLLYETGFSVEDILKIATWNGAEAMEIDELYGSIEVGKKADLVIFTNNPFEDHKNFLSEKVIIKSGQVYKSN